MTFSKIFSLVRLGLGYILFPSYKCKHVTWLYQPRLCFFCVLKLLSPTTSFQCALKHAQKAKLHKIAYKTSKKSFSGCPRPTLGILTTLPRPPNRLGIGWTCASILSTTIWSRISVTVNWSNIVSVASCAVNSYGEFHVNTADLGS